jgi:hypothetical protein
MIEVTVTALSYSTTHPNFKERHKLQFESLEDFDQFMDELYEGRIGAVQEAPVEDCSD